MAEATWLRWTRPYLGMTATAHALRPDRERQTRCGKRISADALLLPAGQAQPCRRCAEHVATAARQAAGEPPPPLREPRRQAPDPTRPTVGAKARARAEVTAAVRAFRARGGLIRELPPEPTVRVCIHGGDDGGRELPPGWSLARSLR